MEAKAYLRYVRISPRKVQIVCDLIRGKDVGTAMAILMQTPKAASEPLIKLLKSAVANAENNFSMDTDKLLRQRSLRHRRPDPQAYDPRPARAAAIASTSEPLTSRSPWRRKNKGRRQFYGTES